MLGGSWAISPVGMGQADLTLLHVYHQQQPAHWDIPHPTSEGCDCAEMA